MPSMMVGADKKGREMQTIPFKYVFGWLFSINPKNVAPEAKATIIKYKIACYDALYEYFTVYYDFVECRSKKVEEKLSEVEKIRQQFNSTKKMLDEAKKELSNARGYSFDDHRQLQLFN